MRTLRLALAAVAVAGVAAPLAAHATQPIPPIPYSCRVTEHPIAQWSPETPVVGGDNVSYYTVQCYG